MQYFPFKTSGNVNQKMLWIRLGDDLTVNCASHKVICRRKRKVNQPYMHISVISEVKNITTTKCPKLKKHLIDDSCLNNKTLNSCITTL